MEMSGNGYKFNTERLSLKKSKNRYYRQELQLMTTHQLREICRQEKIISGIINPLDKDELIKIILKYRGIADRLLIKNYNEAGWSKIEKILNSESVSYKAKPDIKCAVKLVFYEGAAVDFYDELTIPYDKSFEGTNAFIVSEDNTLCAIINLDIKANENEFLYILKTAAMPVKEATINNYSLVCVDKLHSDSLYDIYNGGEAFINCRAYKIPLISFSTQKLIDLQIPLAIDFGNANTTAGVYLDRNYFEQRGIWANNAGLQENAINYAVFYNSANNYQPENSIPTIISIASINKTADDKAGIEYMIGYEVIKQLESIYIDKDYSVFADIKSWLNNYDRLEEIVDIEGQRAFVKRRDILRVFFMYIINTVQNRFKCQINRIHVSCQLKNQYAFGRLLADILPEYAIEDQNMLSESAAEIFNDVYSMIDNKQLAENQEIRALLIDVGSRQSILSACRFKYNNHRVAYNIDMDMVYISENVDFGGNNLTYRIMQLMKIKLARALDKNYTVKLGNRLNGVIIDFDADVMMLVDKNNTAEFYKSLNRLYDLAEAVIPTKFAEWKNLSREDYYKVRHNFYFLFAMAEKIKRMFYHESGILQVGMANEIIDNNLIDTLQVPRWLLSVVSADTGRMDLLKDIPPIYFNILEINCLLRADIYDAINKFIGPLYDDAVLDDFSMIKLSGQSCKIPLFREALSEFVAGKIIKYHSGNGSVTANSLKLNCINGIIKYLTVKHYGLANIKLVNRLQRLPYIITAYSHTGKEIILIDGMDNGSTCNYISRYMDSVVLELFLKDMNGKVCHQFVYNCNINDFSPLCYDDIQALYGDNILQGDTDCIEANEIKFFIWLEPKRWGCKIVPVCRRQETLMLGREDFLSFENEMWRYDFFNGRK